MFLGGLDEALGTIINTCHEDQVPLIFALKRQVLGRVLCKKVAVSVVGIFNYDGAQVRTPFPGIAVRFSWKDRRVRLRTNFLSITFCAIDLMHKGVSLLLSYINMNKRYSCKKIRF